MLRVVERKSMTKVTVPDSKLGKLKLFLRPMRNPYLMIRVLIVGMGLSILLHYLGFDFGTP